VELAVPDRIHNILAEHEVGHVTGGDEHTLLAAEAAALADIEISFDLFVDPADGLNLAVLVYRAGHRQ